MIKTFFFNQISLEIKDGFIAVSLNQRAKELPNIESLKSDERDLLSTIIQLCITGSLEGIEEKMDDLSEDCPFLRTRDREGYCAIHYASNRDGEDAIQIIKILINHGAKLDDRTSKGITVLHIACVNGNVALCKYCLTIAVPLNLSTQRITRGGAPLFLLHSMDTFQS